MGKKAAVPEDSAADFATQMTLGKVAFYGDIFIQGEFFPYYAEDAFVRTVAVATLPKRLTKKQILLTMERG
jgi:hypothetical protein